MLDELRGSLDDDYGFDDEESGDDGFPIDFDNPDNELDAQAEKRFLGMTAGERAFLSVMFFLNVLVLGAAVLVATGRIRF